MRGAIALVGLVTLGFNAALADEGELRLAGAVGVEGTTARHPNGLPDSAAINISPALVVAGGVQYGFTNVIDGALRLEAAIEGNVTTPRASVGGAAGDLVTGLVLDLRLPVAAGAHLDTGLPVSAGLVFEAGPSLTLWSSSALVDPLRKDSDGLPARLPIAIDDELTLGAFLRMKLAVSIRPFDALAVVVEPYLTLAWSSAPAVAFGMTLQPRWTPTIAPL